MSAKERDNLINSGVRVYLHYFAREVFEGKVTTGNILRLVREDVMYSGMHFTAEDAGRVYDAIYEHGPWGENDLPWLAMQTRRQYKYEHGQRVVQEGVFAYPEEYIEELRYSPLS